MDRGGRIGIYSTQSAEDTIAYGRTLAEHLKPGDVICLFGDLGAGKTTLIKGIVGALTPANPDTVCSPTFAYMNIYPGATPVFHFDLYRLEDSEAFLSLGFEEYLFGQGICCIEWSERIEAILPPYTQRITLEHAGEVKRIITHEIPKSPLPENSCSGQRSSYLR